MTWSRSSVTTPGFETPGLVLVSDSVVILTLRLFSSEVAFPSTWKIGMKFLLRVCDVSDKDSASQPEPKSYMAHFIDSFLSHVHTHVHPPTHTQAHILLRYDQKILQIKYLI